MVEGGRRDRALVLARGASRRMGRPKGLCVHGDDPRPLLERVAALYLERSWPVTVVTTESLRELYTARLPLVHVRWLICEPGGGTAATVAAGVDAEAAVTTHFWLHPVDLPFVSSATIATLLACSREQPSHVVIPHHRGRRGHPVVFPSTAWRRCDRGDGPTDMRDVIAASGVGVIVCEASDEGVVKDLDSPEDLSTEGED